MDRQAKARAAASHAAEINAERRRRMPGWREHEQRMTWNRRKQSEKFARALQGYDTFMAVKAQRLAARAATAVDSPETAISDANSPEPHIPTI